jgi:hypothetical protein
MLGAGLYGAGAYTTPTGTITIPSNYADSVTCTYLITTGSPIYLWFDSFSTETDYDFVDVYDGTSTFGTRLGTRFSGTDIPTMQTATSGSMFIQFTSDSVVARTGVTMWWATTLPTPTPTNTGDTNPPTRAPTAAPTGPLPSPPPPPGPLCRSSRPFGLSCPTPHGLAHMCEVMSATAVLIALEGKPRHC